jgi:hypothetical protein
MVVFNKNNYLADLSAQRALGLEAVIDRGGLVSVPGPSRSPRSPEEFERQESRAYSACLVFRGHLSSTQVMTGCKYRFHS